jgi:hypothetical protein
MTNLLGGSLAGELNGGNFPLEAIINNGVTNQDTEGVSLARADSHLGDVDLELVKLLASLNGDNVEDIFSLTLSGESNKGLLHGKRLVGDLVLQTEGDEDVLVRADDDVTLGGDALTSNKRMLLSSIFRVTGVGDDELAISDLCGGDDLNGADYGLRGDPGLLISWGDGKLKMVVTRLRLGTQKVEAEDTLLTLKRLVGGKRSTSRADSVSLAQEDAVGRGVLAENVGDADLNVALLLLGTGLKGRLKDGDDLGLLEGAAVEGVQSNEDGVSSLGLRGLLDAQNITSNLRENKLREGIVGT